MQNITEDVKTTSLPFILFFLIIYFPLISYAAEVKVIASDAAAGDSLGHSVSISGDYAIVGAPSRDSSGVGVDVGAAYIFKRTVSDWNVEVILKPTHPGAGDQFGFSVAIDGNYAVVGVPFRDSTGVGSNVGKVYIYYFSGSSWGLQDSLWANEPAALDRFGWSVSIDGDYVCIGAPYENAGGAATNAGSAYIFVRSGTSWSQQDKLIASDAADSDLLAYSVAIDGSYAITGAWGDDDDGSFSGSAYVFARSGTTWSQDDKLTASDAAGGDRFGLGVSISGDYAVVGSPRDSTRRGSAYVYKRGTTNWDEEAHLFASDAAVFSDFGQAVSIDGDYLFIGTPGDDAGGLTTDAGAAYSFLRIGSSWIQKAKITASDAGTFDYFGFSVSIEESYAIAGAYRDDHSSLSDAGSAYINETFADLGLPVELAVFTATVESDHVKLSWITESEINNAGFILKRSDEKQGPYREISSYLYNIALAGQFNSSTRHEYSYVDEDVSSGKTYWYLLEDVSLNGVHTAHGPIRVDVNNDLITAGMILYPAYPNPFNPNTYLRYDIIPANGSAESVELFIVNSLGQRIVTLYKGKQDRGTYEVQWQGVTDSGKPVSAGIYFVVLKAGMEIRVEKLLFSK